MKIIGCLRVKNEARWIERVLASISPLCESILVFDDHSDDGTPLICSGIPKVSVFDSPFAGLNEARDKNWLLDKVREQRPDWVVAIDGDELLTPESIPLIRANLYSPKMCMSFRVRYLWDREDQVRTDGVYGNFARQSMFRPLGNFKFVGQPPGFHCGNVCESIRASCCYPGATLLHLGYRDRADRLRKYDWYNANDPGNVGEDYYRHMVQGDLPQIPATAKLRHAGPLKLEPLNALSNR